MKKRIIAAVLCIVMCLCICPINAFAASRDTSFEEGLASRLKALGLFQGVSDSDFDLNRAPTRVEALVMLIRVLGQEDEALEKSWSHPFKDVPKWADQYVGYAYSNGLTNGISNTEFGTGTATAATYLTFMLRALGYSDTNNKDFSWKDPFSLAKSIGILPSAVNTSNFWRADVVMVSYAALPVKMKGSSATLAQKLIDAGVFSQSKYNAYYDANAFNNRNQSSNAGALSAEDIYRKCSSMVFSIETWDIGGYKIGSGCGFFIDSSGIALTCNEVMKNAHRAVATLADGREFEITAVMVWNWVYDYAIIQVDGSGFPAMTIGDFSEVKAGDVVYEVGSPLGASKTAEKGTVINPEAINSENDYSYITTSMSISMGNNGSVLVNAKGEAIGVYSYFYSKREDVNVVISIDSILETGMQWAEGNYSIDLEEALRRMRNSNYWGLKTYAEKNELMLWKYTSDWPYFYNNEDEREPNDWPDYQMWIDNLTAVYGELSGGNDSDAFRVCCNGKGVIGIILTASDKDLLRKVEVHCYSEDGKEMDVWIGPKIEKSGDDYELTVFWGDESEYGEYNLKPGVYYIVISFDKSIQNQNSSLEYELFYDFLPQKGMND